MPDLQACSDVAWDVFTRDFEHDQEYYQRMKCFAEAVIHFLLVPGKARKYLSVFNPSYDRRRGAGKAWERLQFEMTLDFQTKSASREENLHRTPVSEGDYWKIVNWTLDTLQQLPGENALQVELVPVWKKLSKCLLRVYAKVPKKNTQGRGRRMEIRRSRPRRGRGALR